LKGDPPELESRVEQLAARLEALERRLMLLERSTSARPGVAPADSDLLPPAAAVEPDEVMRVGAELRGETLPLIGRTILVLAGAFLLRAITEMGILPPVAGTAAGFLYALVWLAMADRAAGRERRYAAMFHGIASAIIALPLIWEATVKFEFLSPLAGAGALLATSVLTMIVVWRRSLRRLAWVVTVGAGSTALVLAVSTRSLALFASFLLILGSMTLWLGWLRGWRGPGWLAAVFADLSVLMATVMVLVGRSEQVLQILHPESVVTLQLALVLVYCGSLGARTLGTGDVLHTGEVTQGAAAVAIGLGGGYAVTRKLGEYDLRLGVVALVLAAGCYAASFAFIDRRSGGRTNFVFYTTAALLFTLVAFDTLLPTALATFAFAAAAVAAAWLGAARGRATLSLHGAAYAFVAAATSGLFVGAFDALTGETAPAPGAVTAGWIVALTSASVCVALPVATHGRTWGRFSLIPNAVVQAVSTLGVASVVVILVAPLLPADPAALAVLRTGVLALATIVLAWLGTTSRYRTSSWLVYPLLALGGLKLLLEDLPAGRAVTLFLSLALYGGALIVAPRILRRARRAGEAPADS
jgi:hypothetical protein